MVSFDIVMLQGNLRAQTMFYSEAATDRIAASADEGFHDIVEEIIWRSELPEAVRKAQLTYSKARIVDDQEIQRLTDDSLNPNRSPELSERLTVRRKALGKVRNREITCAMVRLPGCTYTMEIDTIQMRIVYWEYQAT